MRKKRRGLVWAGTLACVLALVCILAAGCVERQELRFESADMVVFRMVSGDAPDAEHRCLIITGGEANEYLARATWADAHNWCCNTYDAMVHVVRDRVCSAEALRCAFEDGTCRYNAEFERATAAYMERLARDEDTSWFGRFTAPTAQAFADVAAAFTQRGATLWAYEGKNVRRSPEIVLRDTCLREDWPEADGQSLSRTWELGRFAPDAALCAVAGRAQAAGVLSAAGRPGNYGGDDKTFTRGVTLVLARQVTQAELAEILRDFAGEYRYTPNDYEFFAAFPEAPPARELERLRSAVGAELAT